MIEHLNTSIFLESAIKDTNISGKISVFKSPIQNTQPSGEFSLMDIYIGIKSDKYKGITDKVRNGSNEKIKILPFFTPSGTFSSRKTNALICYSGIICIDGDHCDVGLKDTIAGDTFLNPSMIFISPSGNGLKIFIKINNSTAENHLQHLAAITKYLYDNYQLEADQKCKDVARACFLCHDPDVYYSSTGSIDSDTLLSILPVPQLADPQDEARSQNEGIFSKSFVDGLSFDNPQLPAEKLSVTTVSEIPRQTAYIPEISQQPSDELNSMPMVHSRAVSLLKLNGWQQDGDNWTRPGKDPKKGISAKFNINPKNGLWIFTNFSDNGLPFGDKGYTDVGVICLLEFREDWTACIKQLAAEYLSPVTMSKKVTKKPEQPVKIGLLPIDGMPPFIQEYITTCSDTFNTPRDYWTSAVIMATALGIGDKIQLVGRYSNVPILWTNNIGDVSTGKTEAMDQALKPFEDLDSKTTEQFKNDYREYERIEAMSVKDRINAGVDQMPKPSCFQYIVKDSTPEALTQIFTINKRGGMIARDELKGMFDDYCRYSKSGEQSNMLSSYNRVRWVTNRKGGGVNSVLDIPKPCILIYGGMQPDLIPTLAADNRAENGFLARMCNVWPDHTDKPQYNKNGVPEDLTRQWNDYIVGLTRIPIQDNITLSIDADNLYQVWYNHNADTSNTENSGYLKGVYGKLDIIALRLAIVIYGMNLHNGREYSNKITGDEMNAALSITEYFRQTALKVYHKLFDTRTGSVNKKDVIKYLSSLDNSQNEIASVMKVSQQYINKILNET